MAEFFKKRSENVRKAISIVLFVSVLFWVATIFYFSTRPPEKSHQQSNFAYRVIKKIDNVLDFSNTQIFKRVERKLKLIWFGTEYVPAEMVIRKTAHFGLYFVFGFLVALTFFWWKRDIIISVITGFTVPSTYAIFDEYNQIFYRRGSSLNDVVIDSSGALVGVIVFLLLLAIFWVVKRLIQILK
uniref:VanZ-like domain-containing protein n=1 Tax=Fervidobacterium pennivorans TaxID=93466 RepID=A0A7V4NF28_FERPE